MAPLLAETELENPVLSKNHNHNADCYNSLLRPEPSFFKPIRQWEKNMGFLTPLRWGNILWMVSLHLVAVVYSIHFFATGKHVRMATVLFILFLSQVSGFGTTAGVHRLWCHRSYKAKLPLQYILIICYSIAGQYTIYEWVRDHRVHHKFSETSADPHNAKRGFFFSHVGWLMMKKHPDVIEKGSKVDISDITSDPLIQLHQRYFWWFKIAFSWAIPAIIPALVWGENWETSIMSSVVRYMLALNFTWSVNSFAHLWGNKPYDKHIMPSENWGVSMVALGEGWHNYHHTFPWDYKAAELGMPWNLTTTLLNYFAKIGWAYDLKEASPSLVEAVAKARGNSKHQH